MSRPPAGPGSPESPDELSAAAAAAVTQGTANDDVATSQIRGSSLLLAGQSFAVVVNLASQVLIVRYLSQESYGVFAYALSVALIAEVACGFGMRRAVARFMPIYHESGDISRAAGTFILAAGTVLSLGLSVILLVAAFRGSIAGSFDDSATATTVLVLLAGLSAVQALGTLLDGVLAVFGRARAIVARRFIVAPLFRLIAVVLLMLNDQGPIFLAAGYTIAGLLGLMLYGPLLVPTLRETGLLGAMRPGGFKVPAREVLRFTVPLLTTDLTSVFLMSSGGVVLGLIGASTAVAELRAVVPVVSTMAYVLSSFGLLLVPIAARLYARSARGELNQVYWRTAAWTAVLAYPIFLTCVVLAEPLTVLLFGDTYEDAGPVLAVLALGVFVNAASAHNELLLGVFGRVKFLVGVNIVAIVTNLVLVLLLAPRFDAVGAAVATTTALIVLNVLRQIGLGRNTDVHAIVPEVMPLYGAVIGASTVAITLQLTITPPPIVSIGIVVAACATVASVARSHLALAETFPELTRIPIIRQIVGAGRD